VSRSRLPLEFVNYARKRRPLGGQPVPAPVNECSKLRRARALDLWSQPVTDFEQKLQGIEPHACVRQLLCPHRIKHYPERKHVTHLVVEVLKECEGRKEIVSGTSSGYVDASYSKQLSGGTGGGRGGR
jgi:hypothetical protein